VHDDGPEVFPVASVQDVLQALADPVRLEMVRRLWSAGEASVQCSLLYDGVGKSTASHHFKVLREAGICERSYVDGSVHHRLRRGELEASLPGVIDGIVAALED